MKKIFSIFLLYLITFSAFAQKPKFLQANPAWVDSVFNSLSADEKIAQLVMIAAHGYPNNPKKVIIDTTFTNPAYVTKLINEYKVGGVVFFQGGPVQQAQLTNYYQSISKVPLLIAVDAEWGLNMRLDSTVRFPYQMTLGAIQGNDDIIYRMGKKLAYQARRVGINVNFAPSVDINNNPNNPVINFRSFGENKYKVLDKSYAYIKGMQDGGLLTSAKHFPGHGDTGTDSHFELPVIAHNRARLDSVELYPFRELIKRGLDGVMMAHLSIPALDTTKNLPSTLSKKIIGDVLRNDLHFDGLIYSDAMNMSALIKYFPNGLGDAKGIEAGMDLLEFSPNVPAAIEKIKKAVSEGRISQAEIDAHVKKVLAAKAYAGLDHFKPIDTKNLVEDLNDKEAELINRLAIEKSLTILKNNNNTLPIKDLKDKKIASLSITEAPLAKLGTSNTKTGTIDLGNRAEVVTQTKDATTTTFQQTLSLYTNVEHFNLSNESPDSVINAVIEKLNGYDQVVIGLHLNNIRPAANYGVKPKMLKITAEVAKNQKSILTIFGNAYSINKLEGIENANSIVMAYQLTPFTEELSAQLIFGAIGAKGKLPVTVNTNYKYGDGIDTEPIGRLKYTVPEELGINSKLLTFKIDSIANVALTQKATPGMVVQLAKDGKVFFRKAYGNHTYENAQPVKLTDLYDLASVTKVSTSTLALMRLVDEGKFNLDGTVKDVLPLFKNSNKADLVWRDVLTHQAGLKAFIAFWKDCKNEDGSWKRKTFSNVKSRRYSIEITENLFLHRNYYKKIFKAIKDSPLNEKKEYVYSDLSFLLYPQIVKRLTGEDFETYLKSNVYQEIGANSLTYNPLRFYNINQIVPTELDTFFRKTLVHGRVHDEGAAMLGGVSGHAGLFGNANDLMKLTQTYLQKGYFGGDRFVSEKTINEFTKYQFPDSRRGIGFDKPCLVYCGNAPKSASPESYGHTGFTGIMTWNDPKYGLNYVFLSNRVNPTRDNNKISSLNVRTSMMQVVYDLLGIK